MKGDLYDVLEVWLLGSDLDGELVDGIHALRITIMSLNESEPCVSQGRMSESEEGVENRSLNGPSRPLGFRLQQSR